VDDFGAGPQICCQTLGETRYMEEDVAASVVGSKESKSLRLEIGDHRTGVFPRLSFTAAFTVGLGWMRAAGLVSHALFDQCKIGLGPLRCGRDFGRNFEVGIALPCLFKQSFLTRVQKFPRWMRLRCGRRRRGFLPAAACLLDLGRLPVALLQLANNHGGDELLFAMIVKFDDDTLVIVRHDGSQPELLVFDLGTLRIGVGSHRFVTLYSWIGDRRAKVGLLREIERTMLP